MSRFLLMGGGPQGLDAKLMAEWGFEVICLDLTENIQKYKENLSKATELHEVKDGLDFSAIRALAKKIYKKTPFLSAVSFTEWGLLPAAHVNEDLNLQGNSVDAVETTVDKLKMRGVLADKGLSNVRWAPVRTMGDIISFCIGTNYSCVIKDPRGADKIDCFIIRNREDFTQYRWKIARLLEEKGELLAEQFVPGVEVSAETFMWDGEIKFITFSSKELLQPNNVEVGFFIPAQLPGNVVKRLTQMVHAGFKAMDIQFGVCHTELIFNSDNIFFLKTHVRPGGAHIYDLLIHAHDVDVIKTTCHYASGNEVEIKPRSGRSAGVRYFHPKPGRYREVQGIEKIVNDPNVKEFWLDLPQDGQVDEISGNLGLTYFMISSGDCQVDRLQLAMQDKMQGIRFVPFEGHA